jgi:hypothetical protein
MYMVCNILIININFVQDLNISYAHYRRASRNLKKETPEGMSKR